MPDLPPALATRLAKLIPRLGSGHGGEVAATAAAIARSLSAAGCDLHDLAAHVAAAPRIVVVKREREREAGADSARADGTAAKTGARAGRRARGHLPPDEAHAATILRCVEAGIEGLSEWEAGFLNSLAEQLAKGRGLSPRQAVILAEIAGKLGAAS